MGSEMCIRDSEYTVATEMYSAGIDRLTHQPLSFSVSETTEGVHIHIIDAELMGKGEKEKKDLYIEGVQNNGIINHYEYICNKQTGILKMKIKSK